MRFYWRYSYITNLVKKELSARFKFYTKNEALFETKIAFTCIIYVAPSSSKALKHPNQPGFGTAGTRCVVRANHFLVQVADRDLHHYDVFISPDVTSRAGCRKIIKELVNLYKESNLGMLNPAYDGRKSLYTARELPFTSQQFVVNITERDRYTNFVLILH